MTDELCIRTMSAEEIEQAVELAALEGWNPGIDDAWAFGQTDAQGFLIGEVDHRMAGCISAVSYPGADQGGHFGFIGFYIVLPEFRGRGWGMQLWQAGMTRLKNHNVGLDGVVAQQDNYRRSGFHWAYGNQRYEGRVPSGILEASAELRPLNRLGTTEFAALCRYDRQIFPAQRTAFLRAWVDMPGANGLAYVKNGQLAGYGQIRPARVGWKIGPLVADSSHIARRILQALVASLRVGDSFFLDVPLPNTAAMALVEEFSMEPVFETARMYTGPDPVCDLSKLYGVTSFELG